MPWTTFSVCCACVLIPKQEEHVARSAVSQDIMKVMCVSVVSVYRGCTTWAHDMSGRGAELLAH